MTDKIKLAAALPKGSLNGLDEELAEELADLRVEGAHVRPRAMILVYDVKKVEIDDEGDRVVHVRIRRAQPVTFPDGRKAVQQVLHDEYAARNGDMLPFELSDLQRQTFSDLAESPDEQDQREEREREMMSPLDELKAHLRVVHGVEADIVTGMTEVEAETRHHSDHEPGVLPEGLEHAEDDHFWTRADVEARTAVEDDTPPAGETPEQSAAIVDANLLAMGSEGLQPADEGGPDGDDNVRHVEFSGSR
jgi:hypothetical protein